ncbi:putative trehalase [Platanthera guangdongensis]|uniref:Trehalase n=1 Tax=Platanthera guangdongensis TaxID=2320717 RepID=A0ABR2MHF1_9ASPA
MTVAKHILPKMPSYRPNFHAFLLLFPLLFMSIAASSAGGSCDGGPAEHSTPLVSFLQRIQTAALKTLGPKSFDPKFYVDLPLTRDLEITEAAFADLPRVHGVIPKHHLERFIDSYFGDVGGDLVYVEPKEFVPEPEGFLPEVKNSKVRVWALEIHTLWKNLSRRVSEDVKNRPERHTLLPLPEPMIIPGSRFREIYYWDSYWIIRGLLVSKMYDAAKEIVNNLTWLVDTYGHVLNGARAYYVNRSQPPLLSSMVMEIYSRTGDLTFVRKSLPSLLKEYSFWNTGIQDEKSASKLPSASDKEHFYRQASSTAETGWDFSSRWMRNSSDITTLSTTLIIPVDLNAYLYKAELDIAFFAKEIGDDQTSESFSKASKARQFAMRSIFWNAEMNQWLDYWLSSGDCQGVHQFEAKNQNHNIFASNFIPMWNWRHVSGVHEDSSTVERVLKSFQVSGLIQPAGIATTLLNSGQQWDYPNGWAPIEHMIVEGLSNSGSRAAGMLAEDIAVRWIRTNFAAYNATGAMHEKYGVNGCGIVGGGGEYKPQTGFGWSNGVVLALLEEFGWPVDREIECN